MSGTRALAFSGLQHGCVSVSKGKSHQTLCALDSLGWGLRFTRLPKRVEVKGRKRVVGTFLREEGMRWVF